MYLTSRDSRRRVLALPVPGGIVAGLKSGANLVPANPIGTIGFAQYLAPNYMIFLCLFVASS